MTTPIELRPGIRWGRVILGGLLIELLLIVVAVPFFAAGRPEIVSLVIVPATAVVAALCGAWVARGASRPVLNGTLAGVAALALYGLIAVVGVLAAPDQANFDTALSPAYLGSHAFKVLGAMAGGWWVGRGRTG
jgi:hypothetical protein